MSQVTPMVELRSTALTSIIWKRGQQLTDRGLVDFESGADECVREPSLAFPGVSSQCLQLEPVAAPGDTIAAL